MNTNNRSPWFGHIQDGVMHLSNAGMIVDREWKQTGQMRPYVLLDEYVIMPDHFHAIIIIQPRNNGEMPSNKLPNKPHHRPQWKSGSLGAIVQQFKRACTHHIHASGYPNFRWQSLFHDHIIRDDAEFARIRKYIIDNPRHWHS